MSDLQPVRGTHDFLPDDMRRFRRVVEIARATAERYGYLEIATPIFEFSEVFKRTLGDTSDIVTKEMYTFTDKGGETLTLRPEGTAGIMRALISGGLRQHLPLKYFTYGPMFRYERPQAGRMRQFHQLDIELLGVAQPAGDVEVIACGAAILRDLGLLDRTVLELNTLGDSESRAAYRQALVDYFTGHSSKLSQDSRDRLTRNPLRILDSKDEGDRALIKGAPVFGDFLNQASSEFFAGVQAGLDTLGIAYQLNPRLVRGLDYYCHTAFEFTTTELGAQGTVMAGGRYDGLAALMGGPATPGIGWAAGIERLSMMMAQDTPARRAIAVVPIGAAAETKAAALAEQLRRAGHAIEIGYGGNLGKRLKRADKLSAAAAIILGDDELAKGVATLRDLDSGEQTAVPLAELEEHLARFR
ncbi:MAG TPA: histidine--tRNA ligase [Candidatus Polarisedimenticolia bacterium]|nr:histidine--tRNA ligase [Candidatus Polarisedimenticolia bacterium]